MKKKTILAPQVIVKKQYEYTMKPSGKSSFVLGKQLKLLFVFDFVSFFIVRFYVESRAFEKKIFLTEKHDLKLPPRFTSL